MRAQELLQQAEQAQATLALGDVRRRASAPSDGEADLRGDQRRRLEGRRMVSRCTRPASPSGGQELSAVRHPRRPRLDEHYQRQRGQSMPVPKEMNGESGSMGADAFQQLARYVRDVRVAEHQQIGGKPVTTIAGEIDTAGLIKAVTKLGSLAGPGSRATCVRLRPGRPRPEVRRHQGGAHDRRGHAPPRRALVTLSMEAQGQKLELRAPLPAHQLEPAGQAPVRLRLADD